jgi:hypothetical protein
MIIENEAINSITASAKEGAHAIGHGVKVGLADEVNEIILSIAKKIFGGSYPGFFKTEQGKTLAKALTASIILLIAGQRILPKSEFISAGALVALEASSRDFFQPLMKRCGPALERLAVLGEAKEKEVSKGRAKKT